MVSSGPSSLPATLPMGRLRAAAIGAVLIVLGASLVQMVRADRECSRLAPKPPPGIKAHEFTYATDAAYMHLALARKMALPSPGAREPAASALAQSASPAWTSLLAGFIRLGVVKPSWIERLLPLILNLVLAGLLVMLVGHTLRLDVRSGISMAWRLLVVAVLMPIPLLVLTGMEHLAHAFVLLLAVSSGIELIERERLAARRLFSSAIWMASAVSLRFESLAVLAGLVLWAWIRRHAGRSVLLVLAGVGVPIGLGVYLGTHGQSWLPEPVWSRLLGGAADWSGWMSMVLDRAIGNIRHAMVPAALVMVAAAMLWSRREQQSSPDAEDRIRVGWLFVFLVAGVVHLSVGTTGEHFRHTAYLVPLGAVAILRALANRPGAKWSPAAPVGLRHGVMAVFCLLPLAVAAVPAVHDLWNAPRACRQVYLQNRMMAAFVRAYFPNAKVAANEAGALRYGTNAQVLDLASLSRKPDFPLGEAQLILLARPERDAFETLRSWHRAGSWRPAEGEEGWSVEVLAGGGGMLLSDIKTALRDAVTPLGETATQPGSRLVFPESVTVEVAGQTPASEPSESAVTPASVGQ